jgi:hypothetical protein
MKELKGITALMKTVTKQEITRKSTASICLGNHKIKHVIKFDW